MLVPAMVYKYELSKLFAQEMYSEKYFYYVGYPYGFELPNIRDAEGYYQWAIVSDSEPDKVIGYLAYHIDPAIDNVSRFGLYSFDEGNLTVVRDTFNKLEELVSKHRRVEWRVIGGNHAKRGYDRFCTKHKGNRVCLHNVTKDLNGNWCNEYIYEILNSRIQEKGIGNSNEQ